MDEAIIQADLQAVVEGLRAMFTEYGFGAKTSSGYGVAESNLDKGYIQTRADRQPVRDLPNIQNYVSRVSF